MAVAETDFAVGVRNASKLFLDGAVIAFRQLTLDVRNQEILCIVGPSGCGKTTFLRCIAGLIDLSSGELAVFGKAVAGPPPGVAMVFQHFGLLPWKTVYQNAAFGLAMAGAPAAFIKERVRHYLDLVGLTGFEQQYPYQLSGGMQQRVGLVPHSMHRPAKSCRTSSCNSCSVPTSARPWCSSPIRSTRRSCSATASR
jgi:NitT/TauT family transport system ATP-binding protein